MKLHFLGTTGYHANDSRQTACFFLPEIGVMLDAGTGIYRARDLIQTDELHIFISHTHFDHVIGLTVLFNLLHEKETRVTVHVDEKKVSAITDHLFCTDLFPLRPKFEIQTFSDSPVKLPDGSQLTHFPLEHPGGSLGFRIDWPGRSLAYVTDTVAEESAEYVSAIENVDTLIHECYFPDGWEQRGKLTGHSC
ncbi:MAG: MBL fold metallo-hydrolase, partial [Planctomycetota bacterium]